jgi:hypothetical protein
MSGAGHDRNQGKIPDFIFSSWISNVFWRSLSNLFRTTHSQRLRPILAAFPAKRYSSLILTLSSPVSMRITFPSITSVG